MLMPQSSTGPYADFQLGITGYTTSVSTYTMLDPLSAASGILQAFPQHATPVYQAGTFRLKTKVRITRFEFTFDLAGSQSNTLVPADLYNYMRIAVIKTGKTYANSNINYLTSVHGGTNLQDVQQILADKIFGLTSQAFDTTNYNAPQLDSWRFSIDCDWITVFYSTNATGVGAAWENQEGDLMVELVSDSTLAPNPVSTVHCRVFFDFQK